MERTCVEDRRRPRTQRPDRLREEWASVQAAIELVAMGSARRVVLVGLRFAERLSADAVAMGVRRGLAVRLDRPTDGAPAIVVSAPQQADHN